MFRKRAYSKIFVLAVLVVALLSKNNVQAATSKTYDFYNEEGTRVEVTTIINTVYPKNGANSIDFWAILEGIRPTAMRIYNVAANFCIASYEHGSTSMSDLTSVGSTVSASSSFDYDPAWGEINRRYN